MDFRRAPAAFIKPEHYDYYYPYYASPLDYFAPATKSTLAGKTGHIFGTRLRTADPIGGTYMQDIAGTAQGNWFFPGITHRNSADLTSALGRASDYVDPAQPVMAIGTSIAGMSAGLYSFSVAATGSINRAFRDITADGTTYCYDHFLTGQTTGGMPLSQSSGILLLSMPSDTTLKVERIAAASCAAATAWAFSANATTFER